MLHELLLALSGHSSPLFSDEESNIKSNLSSSELALLKQLAHLGHLHQETRSLAGQITTSHPSTIVRATAASITSIQLAAFQQKILDVEQGILSKDQTYVGAYDIVPLSGIATAFVGWSRRLIWLKKACEQMQSAECGAEIINWLRKESKTGFPDVEAIVLQLTRVAERAWLRQLSTWIFFGRLEKNGKGDFLIQPGAEGTGFRVDSRLCPVFVTPATANSILFIGKILNHIKTLGDARLQISGINTRSFLGQHMDDLSSMDSPIVSTNLSRFITGVRSSLGRSALQKLLPMTEIVKLLQILQQFFLLARGEFPVALVAAADQCLQARHLKSQKVTDIVRLGGVMIKEAEVASVLNKTWVSMSTLQDINDDTVDEVLEAARAGITLHIKKRESNKGSDKTRNLHAIFSDTLMATPTALSITVSSPLDLFFTDEDAATYSMINSYLLSIRRSHIHLTELWKLSTLRRQRSGAAGKNSNQKMVSMRSVWAAVFFASVFLTELGEYLQGEVIAESWSTFELWLQKDEEVRDPEILTAAHHAFLSSLMKLLILDDDGFPKALRDLLSQCDQAVAFTRRLESLSQASQAFADPGGEDSSLPPHLIKDRNSVMQNLESTAQRINQSLKGLALRLSKMDSERSSSTFATGGLNDSLSDTVTTFVPWKGAGIRSFLMRLDFRTILDD